MGVPGGVGVGVGGTAVAVGVTGTVGDGVGVDPPEPLQALPLTLKLVGAGLLDVHEPLKPGLALPFTATLPLKAAFATVTFWPDCVNVPFQPCVMV